MITTAVERNGTIYVYGKNGSQLLFSICGNLHGFTSTSVSVKRANTIYVYNERGSLISSYCC